MIRKIFKSMHQKNTAVAIIVHRYRAKCVSLQSND